MYDSVVNHCDGGGDRKVNDVYSAELAEGAVLSSSELCTSRRVGRSVSGVPSTQRDDDASSNEQTECEEHRDERRRGSRHRE